MFLLSNLSCVVFKLHADNNNNEYEQLLDSYIVDSENLFDSYSLLANVDKLRYVYYFLLHNKTFFAVRITNWEISDENRVELASCRYTIDLLCVGNYKFRIITGNKRIYFVCKELDCVYETKDSYLINPVDMNIANIDLVCKNMIKLDLLYVTDRDYGDYMDDWSKISLTVTLLEAGVDITSSSNIIKRMNISEALLVMG